MDSHLYDIDTEILLSILPSNVWAYTTQKLEDKQSCSLENLSNSSLYFRNLTLSKRVLFLFPEVFKIIGPQFANHKYTLTEGSDIITSRIMCKKWNKTVDQFIIDGTPEPDFFNTDHIAPSDHALANARLQYFGHLRPTKLPRFLEHFQQTHLPHFSRNPFIGKVVYIDLIGYTDQTQWVSIADQVSTLLRKYGHHIRILKLGLFKYYSDPNIQQQNHSWLVEWLENCPNLAHLKVSERYSLNDDLDVAFGRRPHPERIVEFQGLGRTPELLGIYSRLQQCQQNINNVLENIRRRQCDYRSEDIQRQFVHFEQQLNVIERLHPGRLRRPIFDPNMLLRPDGNLEPNLNQGLENHDDRFNVVGLFDRLIDQAGVGIEDAQVLPILNNPISIPTLANLQCLNLSHLSALNFNSLVSANTQIAWLQVEPLHVEKHKYIDYLSLEFPNLVKLYVRLCSPEDVRKFKIIHQSWLSLTHVDFEYCMSEFCSCSHNFMDWIEIFELITQNWGASLTDLKLRMPIAKTKIQKDKVQRDTGGSFRLNLPSLKRLKICLSDESGVRVAKTEFLDLMTKQVEELIIV